MIKHKIFTFFIALFAAFFSFSLLAPVADVSAISNYEVDMLTNGEAPETNEFLISFQYKMYFEDVDRDTLFEFMKEIPNDDLWCQCSTTVVTREGWGSRQLGRQWFQEYDFGGVQDELTYTRLWLREDKNHSWFAEGIQANTLGSYSYSDLPNGGTLLTFDGLHKFNFEIDKATAEVFFEQLGDFYEQAFIPYFGSAGNVDLDRFETYDL